MLRLVVAHGHREVTLQRASAEAGLSTSALSYHFPTRGHLLVAALEAADRDGVTLARDLGDDVTFGFVGLIVAGQGRPLLHPNVAQLAAALVGEASSPRHPALAYFRHRDARLLDYFQSVLRQRRDAGLAHPAVDEQVFARQMVAIWHGLETQSVLSPDIDLGAELLLALGLLSRTDLTRHVP